MMIPVVLSVYASPLRSCLVLLSGLVLLVYASNPLDYFCLLQFLPEVCWLSCS